MPENDAATTDTATDQAAETAEAATDQTDQADDQAGDGEQPNENREAAKYRVRARDAEAERDRLAERLTVMQRADAERQAGQRLGKGSDLWAGDVELSNLLDDEGNLSTERINQAIVGVLADHPHWGRLSTPPASMVTGSDKIGDGHQGTTFADAFKPREKR